MSCELGEGQCESAYFAAPSGNDPLDFLFFFVRHILDHF